ncbi:MAG: LysM peptidoglycan-binding domain-containing protein [Deltaproteobacteria bacterium]|nr:LysM peptidoglycan-binding domain-containing protein [Deltaproteobacteria bacterium]
MVDSPRDTREDFVISNGYDEEEEGDLGREDSYSRQTGVLQNKSNLPYIIGGVGLVLIMERVDRFEGTVTTQIDQIIKELGKLHQKTGSAPAPKAKAAQPVAKSTTEKKMKIHKVSAGETLYSISRRYGLTVDQLRTYNNIGKDTTIRPGQKLKLSPP